MSFEFLKKIRGILQKTLSNEETYAAVFDILNEVVEFESATLFIMNKEGNLQVACNQGKRTVDLVSGISFAHGKGLSGWVAAGQEPVILSSVGSGDGGRDFRSLVAIPLWSEGKLTGVLNLGHRQAGFFKHEDRERYEQLGIQLSLIVDQLRLRFELQEKNRLHEKLLKDLQAAQDSLVEKERLAAIGEVVVKLNHEINNSLSIIISYTDMLMMQCHPKDPEMLETLEKMKSAAYRISEVTNALQSLESSEPEEYIAGVKMLKTS